MARRLCRLRRLRRAQAQALHQALAASAVGVEGALVAPTPAIGVARAKAIAGSAAAHGAENWQAIAWTMAQFGASPLVHLMQTLHAPLSVALLAGSQSTWDNGVSAVW